LQKLRNFRREIPRERAPVGIGLHDRGEDIGDRLPVERLLPRERLVEDAPEGPDVRALVEAFSSCLLRAHVRCRSQDDAELRRLRLGGRLGEVRGVRRILERLRETEVEHFDPALARDLDVPGLEIAVEDPLLVGRLESFRDLEKEGPGLVERGAPRSSRFARVSPGTSSITKNRFSSCSSKE
jgi:hypothetical protein